MAKSKTNKRALESSIEKTLTGTTQEELKEQGIVAETMPDYGTNKMFYVDFNSNLNKEYAIDERRFWHFLETTQEEELNKLKRDPQ